MLKFLIIVIATTSIVVNAHVLKEPKNNQFVLTSVYDAMKNNVRQDMQKLFNRNEIDFDSRNKRNTGEKPVYYDNQPSESHNELSVHSSSSDLVCTRRGDYGSHKVAVNDHDSSSSLTFALILKYGLILMAALALPLILFKLVFLPLAILFGLKAATLLNSFLLGSLLYKYKFWKPHYYSSGSNSGTSSSSSTTNTGSSSYVSSSTSSSIVTRPVNTISRPVNTVINDETDYIDIAGPGEDLSRTLKLLQTKNKNW